MRAGEVHELARREPRLEPLLGLLVELRPALLGDRRLLAQQMVHSPAPFRLPMPSDASSPPPDPPRPASSSASSPDSTMSPGWKRMPCAMSRQVGVRRKRNSRSIAKCLNSSVCALRMTASASGSCSSAIRCSYQPIASASSVSEAHSRAKVRVRAGSSSGGSWYWSKPIQGWLPGVDVRTLLGGAGAPVGAREERRDPASCIVRVDHVVDLPVGRHVESAAVLVGGGDGLVEGALPLGFVIDGFELAPHAELDRALEAH